MVYDEEFRSIHQQTVKRSFDFGLRPALRMTARGKYLPCHSERVFTRKRVELLAAPQAESRQTSNDRTRELTAKFPFILRIPRLSCGK